LLWLTAFPQETAFKRVDDIDRCILLLADVKCANRKDPIDERNFHVSIWHEDLLELREKGFVTGVAAVTERRWEELRRADIQDACRRKAQEELERSDLPEKQKCARRKELERTDFLELLHYEFNGTLKKFEFRPLDEYEDYDEEDGLRPRAAWPEFVSDGVIVTDSGRKNIASLLASASAGSDLLILGE
jgi:hypothetical protein